MIPEWMSLIDLSFVVLVLLFGMSGFQQGYARQLVHVFSYLLGMVFLLFLYPLLFNFVSYSCPGCSETYLIWAMLLGMIFVGIGVFMLVVRLMARRFKAEASGGKDRSMGFLFGMIRGGLLLLFVLMYAAILGSRESRDVMAGKSVVGEVVCEVLAPQAQPRMEKGSISEWGERIQRRLLEREEAGVLE